MCKPNFLIVGAAKAGTTALYYYLKQHPDIGFPKLKELKYFSSCNLKFPHNGVGDASVDKYAIKDWKQYLELFKGIEGCSRVGEASPDYLFYHEQTAPLIKKRLGDIPIIIILRNPTKRAFSAYSYLMRDNREVLTFREALDAEDERINNNWDFIWALKQGGNYCEQVATYKKTFTNVKVVLFEEMISTPIEVINSVTAFLGLKPSFGFKFKKHNVSGLPKTWLAKITLSRSNNFSTRFREFLKVIVPRSVLEKIAQQLLEKTTINAVDANFLNSYYKNDIADLERLLERDIDLWKKTAK
jgi:hypothetical protein